MNNKIVKIMVVAGFVLVVLVTLGLSHRQATYSLSQKIALPDRLGAAIAYADDSFVFFNGRGFVAYNYRTGNTSSLSPDSTATSLTSIDSLSMSSDAQYLLFHTEQVSAGGLLDKELQSHQYPSAGNYWWVYSISNQKFQPLPPGILMAKLHQDRVDALLVNGSGESITSFALNDARSLKTIHIPASTDFWAVGNTGLLLQSINNTVSRTQDGTVSQELFKDTVILGVMTDKQNAIGIVQQADKRRLATLDLADGQSKILADNVIGQPVWLDQTKLFYSIQKPGDGTASQTLATYDTTTHTTTTWKFVDSIALGATDKTLLRPVVLLGPGTAIINEQDGTNYLYGNTMKSPKSPNSYQKDITSAQGKAAHVYYDAKSSAFIVNYTSLLDSDLQAAVYQQLTSDGFEPLYYGILFASYLNE